MAFHLFTDRALLVHEPNFGVLQNLLREVVGNLEHIRRALELFPNLILGNVNVLVVNLPRIGAAVKVIYLLFARRFQRLFLFLVGDEALAFGMVAPEPATKNIVADGNGCRLVLAGVSVVHRFYGLKNLRRDDEVVLALVPSGIAA